MKRPIILAITIIAVAANLVLTGCKHRAQNIPTETFVSIWFKIQEDQAFRTLYPDPVKASDEELSAFTKPFGYTAADFRQTKKQIDRDDNLRKEFRELSRKYIDRLALETLEEMTERDTMVQKP